MRDIFFICAVIVVSISNAFAQDDPLPRYSIKKSAFIEKFIKERDVNSNDVIVGFQSGELFAKLEKPKLYVKGLKKADKYICIVLENRSGSYIASANFKNPDIGSSIELALPMQDLNLSDYISGEIALRALVSQYQSCAFKSSFLNVSWRPISEKASVHIFANINTSDIAFFSISGQSSIKECRQVESIFENTKKVFQKYNFICTQQFLSKCQEEAKYVIQVESNSRVDTRSGTFRNSC